MEILLTITFTALFIFLIQKMDFFAIDGFTKPTLQLIFLLKILSGIALWAIYTFYYTDRSTADIYKYFDDSLVIFNTLKTHPAHYFQLLTGIGNTAPEFNTYYSEMHYWARKVDSSIYNDSHTIIRLNALIRIFSFGYYHVHSVVLCFLSLTGLTGIYKTFSPHLKGNRKLLLAATYLLPSVLFWGSGVLKEGLIFFALGLLIYHSTRLFQPKSIFIFTGTAFLLAFSKFYVWLAIFPAIISTIWILKTNRHYSILKYGIIITIITVIGANIDRFTSIQNPFVTLSQKQYEFNMLATGQLTNAENQPIAVAGSKIDLPVLEPTFLSFLINSPQALLNTVLRPFPWELHSPFMLLAGIENIFILIFILLCFYFRKPARTIKWEWIFFCFSFVLIQFLVIGETTPILGAVARYKTIALPFLLIGCLFFLDKSKLTAKIPFLKKILNG